MSNFKDAAEIIEKLQLIPHPEGGHYRQTWIADDGAPRASGTSIYYLLAEGERSHWHRVDAAEIWHYYAGAPLVLSISQTDEGPAQDHVLTGDLALGLPQILVPPHAWQAAKTRGDWTLVGCTVSPAFQFDGFELAPPDFDIPRG